MCYEENSTEKYGLVQHFVSLPGQLVVVVVLLTVTTPHYPGQLGILNKKIISVAVSSSVCAVYVKSLVCMHVHCGGGMFIVGKFNVLSLN